MNARPARPFGVLAATAVIAAIALPAHAQSQDKPDGLWRGTAGLAGSYTSGNTDSAGLALNLDMSRATLQDKITLGGTANYARGQVAGVDTTTSNKWNGAGRYDYNLSPRAFTFGKLGFEGDKLVGLSWRASADAGMGYKLIDTPEVAFTVFGGAGYSSDRYSSPQTIRGVTDTQFSRASLSLAEESRHRLTETVEFKQRLEVNPGISGDRATLAKFNAGLSVAMNSKLGLTVSLGYTHNNKPPDGQGKNDLGVFTGINYKLGAL